MNISGAYDTEMSKLMIKFKNAISDEKKDTVISLITRIYKDYRLSASSWDVRYNTSVLGNYKNQIGILFSICLGLAMFLCLVSLSGSMWANISEQSKEIAIFRSLGLSGWRKLLLYILESLIVVLSSSLMGCIVGIVLPWTFTSQQALLVDFPMSIPLMPLSLLTELLVSSVLVSLFSVLVPVYLSVRVSTSALFRSV
jgi:predicted lysophospholipase L1 biosynthesis ABC-type transport system permease subunit